MAGMHPGTADLGGNSAMNQKREVKEGSLESTSEVVK